MDDNFAKGCQKKVGKALKLLLGGGGVVLERGLLIFPLAVVVIAMMTLWCGGVCALWQMWAGVVVAFGSMAYDRRVGWGKRAMGMGLFLLLLAFMWVCADCIMENVRDGWLYRFPTARLLMMGWNPIKEGSVEALSSWVNLNEVAPFHILFLTHPIEVFNAVFGLFTKVYINFSGPLACFIAPVALAPLWRFCRDLKWNRITRVAVLLGTLATIFHFAWARSVPDVIIGLVGVGMIAAMGRVLRGKNEWWALVGCSLWMMTAKQSALLTCFVFWVCFSATVLWIYRTEWKCWVMRLAGCAILLIGGLCIINSWPYFTSWAHYGHPLYPAYSGNEALFPARDLTSDFLIRNDDAKAMGHVGHFMNAYVCRSVTRAYYAWKLDKENFMPSCAVWRQAGDEQGGANTVFDQVLIVLSFTLTFIFGGGGVRRLAVFCLVALFCFPTAYLGYMRYVPWVGIVCGLSIGVVLECMVRRLALSIVSSRNGEVVKTWNLCNAMGGTIATICLITIAQPIAMMIDWRTELDALIAGPGIEALVLPKRPNLRGEIRLLHKQSPMFQHVDLIFWDPNGKQHRCGAPELYVRLNGGVWFPDSLIKKADRAKSEWVRKRRYVCELIPKSLFISFPKAMARRVASLWRD